MERELELFLLSANLALVGALFVLTPKKSKLGSANKSGRSVLLDSCALIDGRIIDLAEAGFTPETLVIPSFIIRELQMLADGNDTHKRERARFGLDVANKLKELAGVQVVVDRREVSAVTTDDKLVQLAQQTGAQLYTTDFNLAKVAMVEGVKVLNVNELAQKLKPTILPGEKMTIKVVQRGSGRGQGVGYTDDGTMVVIEQADRLVGKTLDVVVDRMHNTLAGKMIFAKNTAKQPERSRPAVAQKPKRQASPSIQAPVVTEEFVSDLRKEIR
jgi:uncharacterized protein YacL